MKTTAGVIISLLLQLTPLLLANPVEQEPDYKRVTALQERLLIDYNKVQLPLITYGDPVNIKLGFVLVNIVQVDYERGQIELNGWLDLRWTDSRLTWNNIEINRTLISADQLWLPDLALYNSVGSIFPLDGVKHRVSVKQNGQIDIWTPAKYKLFCHLVENQENTCSIDIGSWTYNGFMVNFDILPQRDVINLDHYKPRADYEILSTSAVRQEKKYDCCVETYTSVKFSLKFRPGNSVNDE